MKYLEMPIKAKPFEHQKRAFEFTMNKFENGKGAALLVEMGCGKSLISVAVAGELFNERRIRNLLIVCPLSICGVWEEEFSKFADFSYDLKILKGSSSKKAETLLSLNGQALQIAKYEKPIWICATFNSYGKKYCHSSRIPEETIKKLSCEVLGITKFDEQIFKNRVSKIVVPSKGNLKFILNDGNEVLKMWDYPSRRDSWTEEMKQMAKVRQERMIQSEHGTSSNCNSGNA